MIFSPPQNWNVEDVDNLNVLLITAPDVEENWQANISLELRNDNEIRPLDKVLSVLSTNLAGYKKSFKELGRSVKTNGRGLTYGVIEYTHSQGESELLEREIVVPVKGPIYLFVMENTAKSLSNKYLAIFDKFTDSISLKK